MPCYTKPNDSSQVLIQRRVTATTKFTRLCLIMFSCTERNGKLKLFFFHLMWFPLSEFKASIIFSELKKN